MANREISIILRAKNAMASGISSAYKSIQAFGESAVRIGKFITTAFLSAAGAIAGFVGKAVSAYAEQEKAERALSASITAYGENAAAALPALKQVAAAIQDETGVADESTLAMMARVKMLGVQTSKLGEAAKAVIALKSVGMEEAAAAKAVAMAMQGQYTMLQRYVPALRDATDEAQKASIVNDLFKRGYEQQAGLLNTVSGSWAALKGRIGDAWEEIGRAIEQNGQLTACLTKADEAVKRFGQNIAEYAASDRMVALVIGIKTFAVEAIYNFKRVGLSAKITWASIAEAAETAGNYIGNLLGAYIAVWIADFKYLGDYAGAVWEKIKSPSSAFEPPSTAGVKAAYSELLRAATDNNAEVSKRTDAAYAELDQLYAEHAKNVESLASETTAALAAQEARRVQAAKDANAQIESDAVDHRDAMNAYTEEIGAAQLAVLEDIAKEQDAVAAKAEAAAKAAEEQAKSHEKAKKKTLAESASERMARAIAEANAKAEEARLKMKYGKDWEKGRDDELLAAAKKRSEEERKAAEQAKADAEAFKNLLKVEISQKAGEKWSVHDSELADALVGGE